MSTIAIVDAAVAARAPIHGVSIGLLSDKSTWRVTFKDEASEEQRAAALAWIDAYDPNAPTSAQVDAERDRRLKRFSFGGKSYDFVDDKGSDINIAGAATLALAAIFAGAQPNNLRWANPAADFVWIAHDNSTVAMDAQTCLSFAQAAAAWKSRHIYAARLLKDASPIPSDYADDARW